MSKPDNPDFIMTEPHKRPEGFYAFRLKTSKQRLFDRVKDLICVERLWMEDDNEGLVYLKQAYDADEAWHYIRTELEEESKFVELDSIWEDALWL